MTRDDQKGQPAGEPRLGPLGTLAGYHLRRASSAFASDFARAVEGTGLRQVLVGILSLVAANPGINQGAVGKALGIQRANMVALINELVGLDLIERRAAPNDRRAFALRLTAEGTQRLDIALGRIARHEANMLAALSAKERALLIELVGRIALPENPTPPAADAGENSCAP